MNDANLLIATMSADDPMTLLMGVVSMVIVLVALYQGGWKYVVHYAFLGVASLVLVAYYCGMFFAIGFSYLALFGPEGDRAGNFLGAVIIIAAMLVGRRVISRDNVLTRFLNGLMLPDEASKD